MLLGVAFIALISLLISCRSLGRNMQAQVMGHVSPKQLQEKLRAMQKQQPQYPIIPTHWQQKTLPNFEYGGVLVFYHVYKTGGSTVGKMLHEISMNDKTGSKFFKMVRKKVEWEDCLYAVDLAASGRNLIMLELHVEYPAPDFPSLVEMGPLLQRWRSEAYEQNVEFFAFTLLREPVAHTISFFNFFHVGLPLLPPEYWNPFTKLVPSEENFLRSFVGNRQCKMLGSDPESTLSAPDDVIRVDPPAAPASKDLYDCRIDKVYDVLFESMDWVGTTERLQNETLPLLTKLVLNEPDVGRNVKPFKVFRNNAKGFKGLQKDDLSQRAMSRIKQGTQLDQQLYKDVARNFTLAGLGWKRNDSIHE
mmetsp:Transcript_10691/g.17081  ORF Transcript_10691/g.17081 Transcript_10691/m.17081 type:complete len:362 (+) Transcript_10691:3-1088(+)